jgi:hypothetical protein
VDREQAIGTQEKELHDEFLAIRLRRDSAERERPRQRAPFVWPEFESRLARSARLMLQAPLQLNRADSEDSVRFLARTSRNRADEIATCAC